MRRLDRAERADRRLVGLDEHAAHVGVGGQHVLGELEGLIGRVGLHLLQAGFLGDAGLLHRLAEARGARLAVLARLRDRDETDRSVRPTLFLHRRGQRFADAVRALIVVGDDEGDIFAAIGADVGDDDRDIGARRQRQHARRRRTVGRRDGDAGDAARDGVLRVLELRLGAVVRIERRIRIACLLGFRFDALREIAPERQVEARGQIDDFLGVRRARRRGQAKACDGRDARTSWR